ncbi:dTDP-4-dehydrorhamnose 3,5-epimerase family protein [Aquirufa nivalisilvae]
MDTIEGVIITPLKIIENPKGEIYHVLKSCDNNFTTFGEAYFSTVNENVIKGWKKHSLMKLNIVVPIGEIMFVLYDEREASSTYGNFFSVHISKNNYCRLTVPPGVWMSFKGIGSSINLLLNIASIQHDPNESENCGIESFNFNWGK